MFIWNKALWISQKASLVLSQTKQAKYFFVIQKPNISFSNSDQNNQEFE